MVVLQYDITWLALADNHVDHEGLRSTSMTLPGFERWIICLENLNLHLLENK